MTASSKPQSQGRCWACALPRDFENNWCAPCLEAAPQPLMQIFVLCRQLPPALSHAIIFVAGMWLSKNRKRNEFVPPVFLHRAKERLHLEDLEL